MEKGYGLGEPPEEYHGPGWTTIRSNYWKARAEEDGAEELWGTDNIDRMREGKSPIVNGQKIILHHPNGRNGNNIMNFIEMPENEHIAFHRENGYRYDDIRGWH